MSAGGISALSETHFSWLGSRYQGKVRDSYVRDGERILIATDRLSAFDRVLTTVPGKGQILTQMAKYWFERTQAIIPNHLLAIPDPCVMIARDVTIMPVEVVVRGFIAGSAWRDYVAGRPTSGVKLPSGLHEFEQLPRPVVTPYTKEAVGQHDMPISEAEIISRGIVTPRVWEEMRERALQLFALASAELLERGLLFADTKYEFGVLDGAVVLADEIHTLDSSRFWLQESYEARVAQGHAPEMLDKEPIRRWLLEKGFSGEGVPPTIPDDYRRDLTEHYVKSFSLVTGSSWQIDTQPPLARVEANLRRYYGL